MNFQTLFELAKANPLVAGLAIYVTLEVLTIVVTHKSITITLIAAFIDVMGKNSLGGFLIPKLAVVAVLVLAVLTVAMYWVITHPENAAATQPTASNGSQVQLISNPASAGAESAAASTPESEPTDLPGAYIVQVEDLAVFYTLPASNDPSQWDKATILVHLTRGDVVNVTGSVPHTFTGQTVGDVKFAKFYTASAVAKDGRTITVYVFANLLDGNVPTLRK